ncbi:MAG: hypothetical protein K8R92_09265 [Planctomycetes bacterium]|nr:hypothetical protein [Planctomycetota bacterium]
MRIANRAEILKAVQTPLGFFALALIVVEVVFGIVAGLASGTDRTYAIFGMLSVLLLLIIIVAIITFFRPEALFGKRQDTSVPTLPPAGKFVNTNGAPANLLPARLISFGMQNIYNMQDPKEQDARNHKTREIINSGSDYSLLSLSSASYIDPSLARHWETLRPKLNDGKSFRLLIQNPFCREKQVRDHLNDVTRFDSKLRIDLMIQLYNRYNNFDVRFTDTSIYCAVFFTQTDMIYDPYHLGKLGNRIENYFVSFHLARHKIAPSGHSYYEILKQHFEYLWKEDSLGLEDFCDSHQSQLNSLGTGSMSVQRRKSKGGNI